jgi:hypothetical protein
MGREDRRRGDACVRGASVRGGVVEVTRVGPLALQIIRETRAMTKQKRKQEHKKVRTVLSIIVVTSVMVRN